MRKSIILLLLFFATSISSQNNTKTLLLKDYIITSSFQTEAIYGFNGKKDKTKTTIHNRGRIIKVVNYINDNKEVIIQYWNWKSDKKLTSKYYMDDDKLLYFKMTVDKFEKVTTQYYATKYKGAKAGIYSIPFKLRFNSFDFEQDLNLGMSIGLEYRLSKKIDDRWLIEPNIGIGLTKVNLTSKNSNVSEVRSASAFSISLGLILKFSEKINAGIFLGKDYLGKSDSNTEWKHHGKTWLGIGINIGFNTSKGKDSNKNKEIQNINSPLH